MAKLKLNEVSQPVQTQYGWHLLEVLERRKLDDTESYVKQKAQQYLYEQKFAQALIEWQRQLREDTYIDVRL